MPRRATTQIVSMPIAGSMPIDQDLIARIDDRLTEAMEEPRKTSIRAVNEPDCSYGMVIETELFAQDRPHKAAIFAHRLMHVWFGGTLLFERTKASAV